MNNFITQGVETRRSPAYQRLLCGLLVFALFLSCGTMAVFAAWDGQGANGNENSESIVGDYSMPYANESDILGYRFTFYDANGVKMAPAIDIDRKTNSYTKLYRNSYGSKQSHIDLNNAYKKYASGTTSGVNMGYLTSPTSDDWVYLDTSLPSTPTAVEDWLTDTKVLEIIDYAEITSYDFATCYLIVEPYIVAKLDGDYYAMTVAEYAVYQSSLYGWTGLGDQDGGVEGTYRYALMRALSGYFGRYLYAVLEYDVLGTEPVSPSFLQDDAKGTPSVLMSGSTRYNTAANILKYQVGMAVYTGQKADNSYILTVNPNGGTWEGAVF